jgi:hypothetical protein
MEKMKAKMTNDGEDKKDGEKKHSEESQKAFYNFWQFYKEE